MDLTLNHDMAASAADVWAILGERFGDLSWVDDIEASHLEGALGVGAVRVCTFAPNMFSKGGEVRERLLRFDPRAHELAYRAEGLDGVMRAATNRWRVTPLGDARCRVEMHATVELRGIAGWVAPLFRGLLAKMGRDTLAQLERRVLERRRGTTGRSAAAARSSA